MSKKVDCDARSLRAMQEERVEASSSSFALLRAQRTPHVGAATGKWHARGQTTCRFWSTSTSSNGLGRGTGLFSAR